MRLHEATYKTLPYFPLGIVVMPGERVPLRIFEPRYMQLIKECMAGGCTFAIPFMNDSKVRKHGSEVKLYRILSTDPRGEMLIVIEGVSLCRVLTFKDTLPGKLYSGGTIECIDKHAYSSDPSVIDKIESLGINTHELRNSEQYSQIDLNKVVLLLELSAEDKFRFISLTSLEQKEKWLSGFLFLEEKIREQQRQLQHNVHLN